MFLLNAKHTILCTHSYLEMVKNLCFNVFSNADDFVSLNCKEKFSFDLFQTKYLFQ